MAHSALFSFFFFSTIAIADGAIMSELLKSMSSTPRSWSSTTSYCSWKGIKCDNSNRVTAINVAHNSLNGTLPPTLNKLSKLTSLSLIFNTLSGPMPSFANLANLQNLFLDYNNFTCIPDACFTCLPSLQVLSLSKNINLKPWMIPTELNDSSNLIQLDLGSANLIGSLADIFHLLPSLQSLRLSYNNLSGVLPKTFAVSSIQILWLNYQNAGFGFSGSIDTLSSMTYLNQVWLHDNKFTGSIPDLSNCTGLFDLQLRDNQLTGVVPSSLMGLSSLKNVSLDNNMLQGPVPADGVKITLDGSNSFCLSTPGTCDPRVTTLLQVAADFGYPVQLTNSWQGNDPCQNWSYVMCSRAKIIMVNFANLGLSGSISPAFANLTDLRNLYLNRNNFSGSIPDSLTNLDQLEVLDVSDNKRSVSIRKSRKFSGKMKFNADGNALNGSRLVDELDRPFKPHRLHRPTTEHKENGQRVEQDLAHPEHVNRWRWWIWLIIGVGAALAIPVIFYLCGALWRKYKAKVDKKMMKKKLLHEIGGNAMLSMVYGKARKGWNKENTSDEVEIFSFETIVAATNNFSTANKLGEGGFGPVYKGTLSDQKEVAIKTLSKSSGQGLMEFKNEVKLMPKLQHTNLVQLLGFCIERDERILVYEYMLNKSLDFYLFDSTRKNLLDWKKRLNIIGGIAQGLLYLHKYSRLKVIHRDLKAGNILLDEEMNPKISDFGMARIFGPRASQENTNRIVGTYGYMSPEYAMNGVVSTKTDVFSFGVLLLEILSGKKNNSIYRSDGPVNLIGYAWQLWNEDRAPDLIDPALNELSNENEIVRCIHIGLMCVQDQATDRPTMFEVVSFLSNDTIKLPQPKQPAFFINVVVEESELPNSRQEYHTLNDITISSMYCR